MIVRYDHALEPQEIFHEIHAREVSDRDMYEIFNCGIGFIFAVPRGIADGCVVYLRQYFSAVDVIGEVVPGRGRVHIESKFSGEDIWFSE